MTYLSYLLIQLALTPVLALESIERPLCHVLEKTRAEFRMGNLSKDKRDIYYRKAKEEGFRARSAYKLMQVDERFDLFKDVKRVVDLCAAPGSWSQVLRMRLPNDAFIVAVDLQEMAPIEGVICMQGDITSESTASSIIAACGGEKADLVVCDGAPDVTGLHDLDEYVQFQLLLSAMNIATVLLREGGSFVAKIFRGENADLLYGKCELFFEHVYIAKPRSSRNSSTEAFVVCRNFKIPDGYTPRLSHNEELMNLLTSTERKLVPFLACGDLSGYDADMNYPGEFDSFIPPVQRPIAPAYEAAITERRSH